VTEQTESMGWLAASKRRSFQPDSLFEPAAEQGQRSIALVGTNHDRYTSGLERIHGQAMVTMWLL
jgi:hypothetical protein